MISEQAVQIMEEYADDAAKMIATFREMGRERGELEGFESSWRALIEVARLLNSDARLRDALGEARGRAANRTLCAECGEPSSAAINGKPLCGACYDAANAANLVLVEPDAHALMVEAIPNDPSGVGGEDEPTTATLIVSRSYSAYSTCARCGDHALPDSVTHDRVSGYGGGEPGCGARFTAITSDGNRLGAHTRAILADMRPDLPIVEYADRLKPPAQDEPDLAPSDAQDDEAGEVTP